MTDAIEGLEAYLSEHIERWVAELTRLCAVPSVSARHEGVEECAELVAELLRARGFAADVLPTEGHPAVVAHAEGADPGRTLLFYNHYDVQPPEPLELWESPPFEVRRAGEKLFARGVKDDKGELVARLAALDAVKELTGSYPCRITWLVEGEEEIGSPNLPAFVERNRDRLRAEGAIWEEGGVDAQGHPLVALGVRGLLYVELSVTALSRDAHSGQANLLPNAAWRLVWALSTLKGPDERVLLPGFYDRVRPPSDRQEELLRALPSQERSIAEQFGLQRLLLGRTGAEVPRATFEPTCNVAGIGSGYQGPGSKTIVPAAAFAKLDFRLVPEQDPHEVLDALRRHLDAGGFQDVGIEVLGAERPGVIDPDSDLVRLSARIAGQVYGRSPRFIPMSGGTTPMYLFTEQGVPVVAPGVAYGAGNLAHSPNENLRLGDFKLAATHLARLVLAFADAGSSEEQQKGKLA
jgi:acetylornithine deacetylase/succinyl-diaminopimelate desuccinylase-like protein